MSQIAQKQDLSDPEVIGAFAKRVGNERYLTALYLLTVADIRGTSPRGVERLEGQAAGRPVPLHAARAGRPHARPRRRGRGAQARGAGAAGAARPALRGAQGAVGHARRRLLHAPRRRRDRLAHPAAVAPRAAPGVPIDPHAPAIVRARLSPVGEGLQVLVYTPDQPDLFARICGYFDQASLQHPGRQGPHRQQRLRARHLPGGHHLPARALPRADQHGRDRTWRKTLDEAGPCPPPSRGRVSRRVQELPDQAARQPRCPTRRRSAGCSASRPATASGLLYSVARVLARHHLNLQLAKVTTLGERVEDTFLISGPELQGQRAQLDIETELLEALAPEAARAQAAAAPTRRRSAAGEFIDHNRPCFFNNRKAST